jgi:hypothetical protein
LVKTKLSGDFFEDVDILFQRTSELVRMMKVATVQSVPRTKGATSKSSTDEMPSPEKIK